MTNYSSIRYASSGTTLSPAAVTTSDTAPTNPDNGDMWFDSSVGKTFIWYDDGTSAQWVQMSPNTQTGPAGADGADGSSGASIDVLADLAALIAKTGMSNGDQAFVTGNNNLYIYSGTGWYKVATVQNDAPSAITGVNGTYELAIDGTATTITAVSTDPEGFPLTWSYSTSGLGSIATVSHSDGVFTITPSTTEADAGTFSLTINATDGVNGAVSTSTNLTLEFIFIVTNSKYTTLLATAVDTSDNNNITDSSSNNHTITVTGDAHAGTFSPHRAGGYSMYFDGGDYVNLGNGNLAINTEDFTIETWVNITIGSTMVIANNSNWNSGDNTGWRLFIAASGIINLTASQGSWNNLPSIYASTNTISSNEWAHVVICRNSGVISSYINGIKDPTTVNYSASLNQFGGSSLSSYSLIGAYIADGGTYNTLTGYLSDFHFKLGSAKYTTTFSPPTERLTVESGTDVLLFNKPFLKDESTNAHAITVTGNVSTKPLAPFDNVEYSATDHGGSVYFDGTGDYITTPSNTSLDLGAGDFTIEAWIYPTALSSNRLIVDTWVSGDVGSFQLYWRGTGNSLAFYSGGDGMLLQDPSSSSIFVNTWNHVAVSRSGTSAKLFVNGTVVDTATTSRDFTHGNTLGIGAQLTSLNNFFHGYISDVRIIKGSALYTGNFTPPTETLTAITNTSLLLNGTDASIIDKSQSSNLKLIGGPTGSTTQVKFAGSKSMYFDGTGDYISIPADDSIFSKDYTFEFWMYPTQDTIIKMPFSKGIGLQFFHQNGNIAAAFSTSNSTSYFYNSNFGSITANAWSHISLVRDSSVNTYKFYINGTLEDTLSSSSNINTGAEDWIIGGYQGANFEFEGYLQDLRITKGLARYTSNFTPPTSSLEG